MKKSVSWGRDCAGRSSRSSSVIPLAQAARPDFSGKWVLVSDPASTLTITQTADTLTVEEPGGPRNPSPVRMTYKLDGSEHKQTISRNEVVTRAVWDNGRLVTTITSPAANWKDVWSLDGNQLTIVTSVPDRAVTMARTYKKASAEPRFI